MQMKNSRRYEELSPPGLPLKGQKSKQNRRRRDAQGQIAAHGREAAMQVLLPENVAEHDCQNEF